MSSSLLFSCHQTISVILGLEPAFTGLDLLTAKTQAFVLMGLFYPTPFLNLGPCPLPPCSSIPGQSGVPQFNICSDVPMSTS